MSVISVSRSQAHSCPKNPEEYIFLLKNQGVQGDVHCSPPSKTLGSNLRQVHIIESELFQELAQPDEYGRFYEIYAGELGENITTFGIRLAELKKGSKIYFGNEKGCAVLKVTGLRSPGKRIEERFRGLSNKFMYADDDKKDKVGIWKREVGVMGVVERDGYVIPGQALYVEHPKHGKALGYI